MKLYFYRVRTSIAHPKFHWSVWHKTSSETSRWIHTVKNDKSTEIAAHPNKAIYLRGEWYEDK